MSNQNPPDITKDEEIQKRPTQQDVAKQVLGSLTHDSSGAETKAWLMNIREDLAVANQASGSDVSPHMTMLSCIDTLFDHLQRYTFDYNRTEKNPDLWIECLRPDYGRFGEGSVKCVGHLTTAKFSLFITATTEKIRAFIVPAEFKKDFQSRIQDFTPFLEMFSTEDQGSLIWRVEGSVLLFEHLSVIAKKLFARLLRVTKGEASELEPFTLGLASEPVSLLSQTQRIKAAAMPVDVDEMFAQNYVIMASALSELSAMVGEELQYYNSFGVKAIQSEIPNLAPRAVNRTKALRELKEKIDQLSDQWKTIAKDK